jgi:hypothetical protein
MDRRDPQDERRDERLAGSSLASFLLHLLAAAFLVSIAAAGSQESSSDATIGGAMLTISQQIPVASAVATPRPAPSHPPVQHVAPVQRPPMHPVVTPRPVRHELTYVVPSAPPNPTPQPQFTPQPLPAPTLQVAFTSPTFPPTPKPTAHPKPKTVATERPKPTERPRPSATPAPTAKPVPTHAPTMAPTHAPTIAPTHAPTMAPTHAPTIAPTHAPTPARKPVVAHTTVPHPTTAPTPREVAGVPSPRPVVTEHPTTGRAATPGPQSQSIGHAKVVQRMISVAPTPSPRRSERPRPSPTRNPYGNLNAHLNALIPQATVTPHEGHYVGSISLEGRLDPTPPPEALARTHYVYEGADGSGTMKMWVTSITRRGPVMLCTGWIVRYPQTVGRNTFSAPNSGPANGIQIGRQHSIQSSFAAGMNPIVVGDGTAECSARGLTPYTPGSSP